MPTGLQPIAVKTLFGRQLELKIEEADSPSVLRLERDQFT